MEGHAAGSPAAVAPGIQLQHAVGRLRVLVVQHEVNGHVLHAAHIGRSVGHRRDGQSPLLAGDGGVVSFPLLI